MTDATRGVALQPAAGRGPAADRRTGPAAGEPPLLVDPRRWGSLLGLAGGVTFIVGYSSALGPVVSAAARAAGLLLVVAALLAHYVRPVPLGPLARPRPVALASYAACVLGMLALLAAGTRVLARADESGLRPALIVAVVGLHFLPFAWVFQERMFLHLGGAVTALGVTGFATGALGVARAPDATAVLAGLVMLVVLTLYAQGRFARTTTAPQV